MNINQSSAFALHVFLKSNRDDDRWAPANEIAVYGLAPPTTGEPVNSSCYERPVDTKTTHGKTVDLGNIAACQHDASSEDRLDVFDLKQYC